MKTAEETKADIEATLLEWLKSPNENTTYAAELIYNVIESPCPALPSEKEMEKIILNWLKSDNENITHLVHLLKSK